MIKLMKMIMIPLTFKRCIFQVLTKQYYAQQTSMEKRVSELETVLTEKTVRLESYEKLEHELDEVVMQAADGKCVIGQMLMNIKHSRTFFEENSATRNENELQLNQANVKQVCSILRLNGMVHFDEKYLHIRVPLVEISSMQYYILYGLFWGNG